MDPLKGTLKGSLILGSNFGRLGANRAAATTEGTPLSPGLHRKRRPGPEKSGIQEFTCLGFKGLGVRAWGTFGV